MSDFGTITGFLNPVLAAEMWVARNGIPYDMDSFERVAKLRGDAASEVVADGFIVTGYDDLQRLCDIGDFCLANIGGRLTALVPDELHAT
jgi:hypothetical protein